MVPNNSDDKILSKLILVSNMTANAIHKESNGSRD